MDKYAEMANQAVEKLLGKIPFVIELKYEPKARYVGQASVSSGRYTIRISDKFFKQMEDARKRTIEHEVCHLVDYFINGAMDGHGLSWIALMQKLGYDNPASKVIVLGDME